MKYRANSQDTWHNMKIKALDSMPVGTMVDYDGEDIPTGWEEVNDYSTTEVNTGKTWIDGKPIYRKVYTVEHLANTGRVSVPLGITYDKVLTVNGYFTNGTNILSCNFPNQTDLSYTIKTFIEGSNIHIDTGSDRSAYYGYVWIEYTKSN